MSDNYFSILLAQEGTNDRKMHSWMKWAEPLSKVALCYLFQHEKKSAALDFPGGKSGMIFG